jgi:hypothetical protein
LPRGALVESRMDSSLAVRDLATDESIGGLNTLTREVVMVTTSDRLLIPPIANFRQLVHEAFAPVLPSLPLTTVQPLELSKHL